jgi:hypothetical protein
MRTRASLFAIAVLFLYGSPAYALTHVAPPGNSGASQYQEDVPSAGGSVPITDLPSTPTPAASATTTTPAATTTGTTPTRTTTTSTATTPVAAVPAHVLRSLERAGRAGRQAAALADRTAPSVVGIADVTHSRTPTLLPRAGGGAGVSGQVASAVVGGQGGGLGLVLPLALGASLLAAIAFFVLRRRRGA